MLEPPEPAPVPNMVNGLASTCIQVVAKLLLKLYIQVRSVASCTRMIVFVNDFQRISVYMALLLFSL